MTKVVAFLLIYIYVILIFFVLTVVCIGGIMESKRKEDDKD